MESIPQDFQILEDFNINSFTDCYLSNTFCVFKSIDNIPFLIFSNKEKSIISFNLINNQKINKIKNAHNEYISFFKHYIDNMKKIDLIMSISSDDNNIKIWNVKNFECLLNLQNVNNDGFLLSASILEDNSQNYIISSNCNWNGISEPMKIFDFKGNEINQIKNSKEEILFTEIFYDNKLSKKYIITGTSHYAKSYNYDNNEAYHEYYEIYNAFHFNIIIYNIDKIIKLLESGTDGYIRIWNFHAGTLLKKIHVDNTWLYGICLWNKDYLFVGCSKNIKLIDLNSEKIIKILQGHNNRIVSIKKFCHQKYGNCLLSQGFKEENIKIWINKI